MKPYRPAIRKKIEELVLKHVDQAYKSIQKGTSK